MSPEPSTNDYLADEKTEYAVFDVVANEQLSMLMSWEYAREQLPVYRARYPDAELQICEVRI